MSEPNNTDITRELLRDVNSTAWLSPDRQTLVAILHDPEASAYGLTPGHRWVGRLITLPNDIPHLPADEELPTPEALGLRMNNVAQTGGFVFPLWHDPEVTGAFEITWTCRKPPENMHAPKLLGAYLLHPDERVYKIEETQPDEEEYLSLRLRYILPVSELRDMYEQFKNQIADIRSWTLSGTYTARVYRMQPCPHCSEFSWYHYDHQRALHGYDDVLFFLQFHPLAKGFTTSGDGAWTNVTEAYVTNPENQEPEDDH